MTAMPSTLESRTRRVVPADLYSLPIVHDVALCADGRRIAYIVTTMNADDDSYGGSLRVASTDGASTKIYTRGATRDEAPQWLPDGRRLMFVSDRSGKSQLWFVDADGGEPYPAPAVNGAVSAAAISPDGRFAAVVAMADVGKREVARRGWRRITRVRYRADGAGYLDDFPQLWLIDLMSGDVRALTDGSGAIAAPAWSPDGAHLAFVGEHRPDADSIWHTELWTVDVRTTSAAQHRCGMGGALETPAWSTDGSRIAFLGHDDAAAYALATLRLYVVNADGSDRRCLTPTADWTCGNVVLGDLESSPTAVAPWFSPDGSIVVLGTSAGSAGAFAVGADGMSRRMTPPEWSLTAFSAAHDTIAACASDSQTPPEIFLACADGSSFRRLTSETASWCRDKTLRAARRMTASGPVGPVDGWHLQGDGSADRPCVLEIHGGPHAAYGNAFFLEFQLLAAAGFDVVFGNPRGSQGYGDTFVRAIVGDWAMPAFDDCMALLDTAIAHGGINATRLGVAGGSYGGYMTTWAVTQTNRFGAAVAMRATTNLVSLWGTSEVGRMLDAELGGRPGGDLELYRRCSPLTFADRVSTPLLLVHAEHDFRCPIEQSEQFFTALKVRGAEVEFLRFAEGDHGLSRSGPPRLRVARLEAILEWFERHLGRGTRKTSI